MNDFFNSKFIRDLQGGKLPPVEVQFGLSSLTQLSLMLFITAVAIMLASKAIKNL